MDAARFNDLSRPFVSGGDLPTLRLSDHQLQQLLQHFELLLRWNRKTNLTAVRNEEEMVQRHFGESLFLARVLQQNHLLQEKVRVADLGSGAGFPGIPVKICFPHIHMTLIESQNKKATFLKEVIRSCILMNIDVWSRRAEDLVTEGNAGFDVVVMRAVDDPRRALKTASQLIHRGGSLGLLAGQDLGYAPDAQIEWRPPILAPESLARYVWIGRPLGHQE